MSSNTHTADRDDLRLLPATVLIASRERPRMLLDTVRSVVAARRIPREIVVVDQSLHPNVALRDLSAPDGCEVRYVHSQERGLSRGRNVGLRMASQDFVVILDDDMWVNDDSLERLVTGALEDRDGSSGPQRGLYRVVATGRVLAAPPERPGLAQAPAALVTREEPEVFRGRQPRQVVPGPNIAVPRLLLLDIGGYDERLGAGTRFPAGEDHDLSMRLLDAGCEVRHIPQSVVLHRSWRSPGRSCGCAGDTPVESAASTPSTRACAIGIR
jgi:GT2 family glycosyltransferase